MCNGREPEGEGGESGHQPGEDLEPGAIWLLTLAAEAEGHTAGLNLGSVWYNEISVDLCVVVIPGFVWSPAFFFFQVLPQSTSFTIIDVRGGGEEFFLRRLEGNGGPVDVSYPQDVGVSGRAWTVCRIRAFQSFTVRGKKENCLWSARRAYCR